jgi:hypothetical protein
VSGSEWIGLGAVVVFALLVLLLAVPLLKLGRFLDEATLAVQRSHEQAAPTAGPAEAVATRVVERAEPPVVAVPEPLDVPSGTAAPVAPLSTVVAATLGGPLIKVASLGYGVRSAARTRQESRGRAAAGRRGKDARRTTTRRVA